MLVAFSELLNYLEDDMSQDLKEFREGVILSTLINQGDAMALAIHKILTDKGSEEIFAPRIDNAKTALKSWQRMRELIDEAR